MALQPPQTQKPNKNKLDNFTFKWAGNEITLRTSYSNIEALEAALGMSFMEAILMKDNLQHHVRVFYYLQYGTKYTMDEIQDAFFPYLSVIDDPEWCHQIERLSHYLLGLDKLAILADGTDATKKK